MGVSWAYWFAICLLNGCFNQIMIQNLHLLVQNRIISILSKGLSISDPIRSKEYPIQYGQRILDPIRSRDIRSNTVKGYSIQYGQGISVPIRSRDIRSNTVKGYPIQYGQGISDPIRSRDIRSNTVKGYPIQYGQGICLCDAMFIQIKHLPLFVAIRFPFRANAHKWYHICSQMDTPHYQGEDS